MIHLTLNINFIKKIHILTQSNYKQTILMNNLCYHCYFSNMLGTPKDNFDQNIA